MFEWVAILCLLIIIVFLMFSVVDSKKLELENKEIKKEVRYLRKAVITLKSDDRVKLMKEEI